MNQIGYLTEVGLRLAELQSEVSRIRFSWSPLIELIQKKDER